MDTMVEGDSRRPLPRLLALEGYQPRKKGPAVYVYELPPHMTSWCVWRGVDMDATHVFAKG